jgi:hypothetical protein
MNRAASTFVLFLSVLLCGCGNKTCSVHGRVTFADGTPAKELSGYMVSFQSDEQKVSARGTIQSHGSFTVETFQPGDGAVPGKHKVAITPPPPVIDMPIPPPLIDKRYHGFDTSNLEVTITSGKNEPVLKVERVK